MVTPCGGAASHRRRCIDIMTVARAHPPRWRRATLARHRCRAQGWATCGASTRAAHPAFTERGLVVRFFQSLGMRP